MLKRLAEEKLLIVMLILSVFFHAFAASKIDLRDKKLADRLKPISEISEVSLHYIKKTPPVRPIVKREKKIKVNKKISKVYEKKKPLVVDKKIEPKKGKAVEEEIEEEVVVEEVLSDVHEEIESAPEIAEPFENNIKNEVVESNDINILKKEVLSENALGDIKKSIRSKLRYPSVARRMRWAGTVKVSINLFGDGKLKNVTILCSSGYKVLDETVVKAVEKAAPFDISYLNEIELTLPVHFTVKGMKI
jgi:protein TonB